MAKPRRAKSYGILFEVDGLQGAFMSRSLITKREITEQDLLDLVANQQVETDWFDCKRDCYQWNNIPPEKKEETREKKRHELCKDVSAMANAQGGVIVLGLDQKKGRASDLCGLGKDIDPDTEINRLRQVLDDNLEPKVSFRFQTVELNDDKGCAIVIQIPNSPAKPHAVQIGNNTPLFYIRRINGTGFLTREELRVMFTQADQLVHRVKAFRKERIGALTRAWKVLLGEDHKEANPEIPVFLADGAQIVMHVVPVWFSLSHMSIDLTRIQPLDYSQWVSYEKRFNFDGAVIQLPDTNQIDRDEYYQFFRDGRVEWVKVVKPERRGVNSTETESNFHITVAEEWCINALNYILDQLDALEIVPQLAIMVTLNRLKGFDLRSADVSYQKLNYFKAIYWKSPIRDMIPLPEAIIDAYPDPSSDTRSACAQILRHPFDILWNTFGYLRCPHYDNEGNRLIFQPS